MRIWNFGKMIVNNTEPSDEKKAIADGRCKVCAEEEDLIKRHNDLGIRFRIECMCECHYLKGQTSEDQKKSLPQDWNWSSDSRGKLWLKEDKPKRRKRKQLE